jgi:iron complex outermembrane recepter protein
MRFYNKTQSASTLGLCLILGFAFMLMAPRLLMAQSAAVPDQIEEITVTAEKKSSGQQLQKTPIAITAVTAQTIEDLHITDVTDIGRMAPNVELDPVGTFPGFANFTIRGIGVSTSIRSVDPAVNIFQDGMVIAYQAGAVLDTFDTESVQVLRGPQGVLFGRNSAGGAVLLTTPMPTKDFHYSGDVSYGNFNEVDVHAIVQGGLSSSVSGKIAVSYRYNEGVFENNTSGTFVPAPANPTGDPVEHPTGHTPGINEVVVKPTFLVDLSDTAQLKLFTQYQKDNDGGGPSQAYIPPQGTLTRLQTNFGYYPSPESFTTNLSDTGYTDIEAGHAIAEFDWTIGPGTWTTVAAFRAIQYNSTLDSDGTPFTLTLFPNNTENNQQESLESRYNGHISDKLEYVAGVYLFTDITSVVEKRALNGFTVGLPVTSTLDELNKWDQRDYTGAGFGNIDYKLLPDLTLSAGLRYEYEYKHMHIIPLAACSGTDFSGCPSTYYDSAKSWTGATPRAVISYDIAADMMTYASYSKGFTAGNYNARAPSIATALLPTAPESVNTYEVGYKSQWLDRRVQFNLSLYDNQFENIQRTVNTTTANGSQPLQTLLNAANATIRGAELETTAIVYKGLRLNFSAGYTNAYFTQISGLTPGVNGLELQLDHVPRWTLDAGAKYEFELPKVVGKFEASIDYSWRSMIFSDLYNTPQLAQNAYGILNASVSYTNGPYFARLYGRNLENTDYAFIKSIGYGYQAYGGLPRMYGIEFGFKH